MKALQLILVSSLLLTGCHDGSNISGDLSAEMISLTDMPSTEIPPPPIEEEHDVPIGRMVIRNAEIEFQVDDLKLASEKISVILKKYDAYVSKGSTVNNDYRIGAHKSIRVLSKDLDGLIHEVTGLASHLENQSINSKDVTVEYIDIESRMKNKIAVEQRYIKLLDEAKDVQEIIKVEEKIAAIRGDIDSAEGRLKYLKNLSSYSTLNVHFYQELSIAEVQSITYGSELKKAVASGWEAIKLLILGLVYLWPIYLLAGLIFAVIKFYKKRKKLLSV